MVSNLKHCRGRNFYFDPLLHTSAFGRNCNLRFFKILWKSKCAFSITFSEQLKCNNNYYFQEIFENLNYL